MPPIAIVALICATLFTGAAGYITLVEHPARLQLEDVPMLAQWQPSYAKALPIQSGLAIAGGLAGIASSYLSGDLLWMFGSLVLLAKWPFTLIAITPTNKRLQAIRPDRAGPASCALLLSWESCRISGACWVWYRRQCSHVRSPPSREAAAS